MTIAEIQQEILRMKKEQDICILAHAYQGQEILLSNAITHYIHDSRDDASIPNNIVWACFVDKWQNVWVEIGRAHV